jgi:hypothetical protein
MSTRIRKLVALLLAASAAYVGGWASIAPMSFFRSFPGLGMHWTAADGPYNQHLVRDVGGLYLSLLVISVCAALSTPHMRRIAGAAWAVFSVLHFIYHLRHLDVVSTTSAWLESTALGLTLLGALLLVLPERGSPPAPVV